MRIVFWQNCLSPHQLPYIVHLMDGERVDEVVVVAGETVSDERKKMGWSVAKYEGIESCKVYVAPSDDVIRQLMGERQDESWHLFSGIRADVFVFKCLRISLSYNLKRGIITERPNTYDFKHSIPNAKPYWMHRLRFLLQDRKYAKHIQVVFAMGQEATDYFRSLHMEWHVFPFCYCTQYERHTTMAVYADRLPQYLFCGSLSVRKDPLAIAKSLSVMSRSINGEIRMIGDGIMRHKLGKYICKNNLDNKIYLLGAKSQIEVPFYMQQADVFILPSLYDGWGAVVNEALQAGCYVICSDACGASDLIRENSKLGVVFPHGKYKHLANSISWCDNNIDEIKKNRLYRQEWADRHISGAVVAEYLIDCLLGKYVSPVWM